MLKILLDLLSQLLSSRSDNKKEAAPAPVQGGDLPEPSPKPEPAPAPKPQPELKVEPKRKQINAAGLNLIKTFEGLKLES